MSIHSHLPFDQSTSHARVPAGGIHLIASIDSVSEAQFTASFFGSTKALHGEVAIPSAETSTHNHSNQQYSITAITTSAGAIAERYAYSAYGEPTICDASGSTLSSSAINNRYSYTGREWDATAGLYHFRARWMSPKSGRFLGRDPMALDGGGYNLFEFLNSKTLVRTDPNGEFAIDPIKGQELTLLTGCDCAMTFKTPTPKEAEAWVTCDGKGGFKIKRQPDKDIKNFECMKDCGGLTCLAEHENHHESQFLALCPKACAPGCGRFYGEDEGGIGITAGACRNIAECFAGRAHLNCLNRQQFDATYSSRSCGGKTCRAWLKEFFDTYKNTFQRNYACQHPAKLPDWIDPTK